MWADSTGDGLRLLVGGDRGARAPLEQLQLADLAAGEEADQRVALSRPEPLRRLKGAQRGMNVAGELGHKACVERGNRAQEGACRRRIRISVRKRLAQATGAAQDGDHSSEQARLVAQLGVAVAHGGGALGGAIQLAQQHAHPAIEQQQALVRQQHGGRQRCEPAAHGRHLATQQRGAPNGAEQGRRVGPILGGEGVLQRLGGRTVGREPCGGAAARGAQGLGVEQGQMVAQGLSEKLMVAKAAPAIIEGHQEQVGTL